MDVISKILNIPFKPWEYMTYTVTRHEARRYGRRRSNNYSYEAQFETLKNYNRSYWKLGDVVKFGNGLYPYIKDSWESWFLNGKDLETFIERNNLADRRIPVYARNQYAIILARYRWIKRKYSTFSDYGSFIMMLTGDKVGHMRKYYTSRPYEMIERYPYTKNILIDYETLFHGVERGDDVKIFLEKLMRKLNE